LGATIGIVGGGQLGRMSAMAAARLGYRCHIFTPEAGAPASLVSAATTIGAYDDFSALRAFAEAVDVVTFEFENVSAAGLDLLAALKPVHPAPSVLRVSQDRVAEKSFVNGAGLPTAAWMQVDSHAELTAAIGLLGLPAVLKTTRLGYDGRGQATLRSAEEAQAAWEKLAPKPLILEAFVDFACEISVIVARGADGQVVAFDAVENRHRTHILDLTLAPAQVVPDIAAQARHIATELAEALQLVGLLTVEMFVGADGQVLVNEIAPRPHNSGHWTIDACPASQFDMHVRAVAGLPLPPATRHADAVMKNLIGPDDLALWPDILATPGLIPHHYGKTQARPGRKMGHVTRLWPRGSLPGPFGIEAALGLLGVRLGGSAP
jgi:5-(carboxyamino)imidazole ribonucleotide synthase